MSWNVTTNCLFFSQSDSFYCLLSVLGSIPKDSRPSTTQQRQPLPSPGQPMSQGPVLHSPGTPVMSQHHSPVMPDVMYNPTAFHSGGAGDRMTRPPGHLMTSGYVPSPHWPTSSQPPNMAQRLMMPFYHPYGVFPPHPVPTQQVSIPPCHVAVVMSLLLCAFATDS